MSSNGWQKVRLGDIAEIIDSLHKTPSYSDTGFPMVRVTDIKGGFLSLENTFKVTEDVYEEFSRKHKPRRGDIVFSRVGTYGVASYVNSDEPFCLGQNTVFIVPKIDNRFLYYSLTAPVTKNQIEQLAVGSTQKTISLKSIKDIEIRLPDLSTQRRIADILSALDDKIELNRQTNATLEAIAQAIFKEWFVDFNYPGATGELADSELGLIPAGWRVGKLGEILSFKNGKTPPERKHDYEHPVYGANGIIGFAQTFNAKEKTIIVGRVGSFCGTVYYTLQKSYVTDNAIIAEPLREEWSVFAFILLQTLSLNNYKVGSGQPLINQTILSGINILIPDFQLMTRYEEVTLSHYAKVFENEQQSKTLVQIRDTLLPKLMYGEIEL